jgi:hypothetical protein
MRADSFELDELIRAELDATRPEPTFDLDRIETRGAQLRWKGRTQLAVLAVAAVIAVVVALAATATTGSKQVNVADDRPATDTPVTTARATTTTIRPTTTTITATPSDDAPRQPSRAAIGAGPSTTDTVPSIDTPTTVDEQPTPTTVKTVTPTTTPTTPTTVYDPYPPVPESGRRMIIMVDDDGVHAPATFKGDKPIQIVFVDNRTVRPNGDAMLYSTDGGFFAWAWDGTKNEVGSAQPPVGPWELNASDRFNNLETFTIEITAG